MKKNRSIIVLLAASQLFYILFLPIWFTFFGLTVITSEQSESFLLTIAEYIVGAYPVVLIAAAIVTWSAWRKGKLKKMLLLNTIPILWIAPILITFLLANL
ncbi:hypothetical protein P6709_13435 [Jeotgalibacillus sp. ET6]|uniref:hypothetical protein n=1 Tax=Jeotgalibacillus sp. ET6 TaxID=3037260 RepID=UPI002418603E|nr:hypothetical protein [Jeotgalibacillus sp. ET6]MDG5472754.1 hypothetical protein [Jeotgalibacillus sp. ET6]